MPAPKSAGRAFVRSPRFTRSKKRMDSPRAVGRVANPFHGDNAPSGHSPRPLEAVTGRQAVLSVYVRFASHHAHQGRAARLEVSKAPAAQRRRLEPAE